MELVVMRSGQHEFSEIVRDYLTRITYGGGGRALRARLPSYQHAQVVVDPRSPSDCGWRCMVAHAERI